MPPYCLLEVFIMPAPFPGMNPYLEQSTFWQSFHTRLLVAIADVIEPQLKTHYYVEVEARTYQSDDSDGVLIGIPDAIVFAARSDVLPTESLPAESTAVATQSRPEKVVIPMPLEVKERYLEVREMETDEVVAVIELLSFTNKRSGEGRAAYEKKRRLILGSQTHLVELDLLRAAKPMAMRGGSAAATYRILVSRSEQRPTADLYSVMLREPLPSFPIPLKAGEQEPIVPLQDIVDQVYERGRYASRINYRQPAPPPALSESDQQWVDTIIRF